MKRISNLVFWLKVSLGVVPTVYLVNFIYALATEQTGGTFGDTFGAANALFSGTALLMLVLAVILQREELEQVKEERNDTRKLLRGQETINLAQEKALSKQSFEQSFFALVQIIAEERRVLDSKVTGLSDHSIISAGAMAVKQGFNNTASLSSFPLHNYTSECGSAARLLIASHGLLMDQNFGPRESLIYISTLHALMDSDFAHVICSLGHRWFEEDPRVIPALKDVQIIGFIDKEWKSTVEEWLASTKDDV